MTVRIAITTGIHFPRLISFPSYLAMKRDKRHWRAVSQSHSTCFPRHGGILVGRAPIGTVGRYPSCVPPQGPFEQSEQCRSKLWKRLNDAAGMRQQGCNTRTHDAEAVAFESLFLSLFKRLLCGRDGVGFSVRDDQDDFPVLAEETHLLHDPPERFRHRSHPVGDFGESGGELFTVPKNGGNRRSAFRPVCAGKRRNAQILYPEEPFPRHSTRHSRT